VMQDLPTTIGTTGKCDFGQSVGVVVSL